MIIIPRSGWRAAPAKGTPHHINTPTPDLWLHHTAGALDAGGNGVWWDDVKGIQRFHQGPDRGWSDIAYSFLVGGGQVFAGRGAGIAGGHTKGHNTTSHAICLIGDYSWMTPKPEDLEAIAQLAAHGKQQGWWGDLTGAHRDASGQTTTCCGDLLAAEIPNIRARVDEILTPQEDDDMALPKYAQQALAMQRIEHIYLTWQGLAINLKERRLLEADVNSRIDTGTSIDALCDWLAAAHYAKWLGKQ